MTPPTTIDSKETHMQLTSLFKVLTVSAALSVVPSLASAQAAYPTRAIKIIVPAPPGGAGTMILMARVG